MLWTDGRATAWQELQHPTLETEYSRRSEERSGPSDGDGSLSLLRVGGSQRGGVGGRREAISTALT